jgi:hypothetical protein
VLGAAAAGADGAVGPAELGDELDAHVLVGEVADGLDEGVGEVLGLVHKVSLVPHLG